MVKIPCLPKFTYEPIAPAIPGHSSRLERKSMHFETIEKLKTADTMAHRMDVQGAAEEEIVKP